MQEIVDAILQGSYELDGPAIIRLIVLMMGLELFTVICGLIGQMKGR